MIKTKGFTLIEVMVVIVIFGMLVAFSIPMFNNRTAKQSSNYKNLIDRLNVARQEAITKNMTTSFYFDADSFIYNNNVFHLEKGISLNVTDASGATVLVDAPLQFLANGSADRFVAIEFCGYTDTMLIYVAPSGYILFE